MAVEELEELVAQFASGRLPKSEWTHAAHLRVGAWYVYHHGADAALALLRAQIRRLNLEHGTPNSASEGYHETITAAYVRLLAEYLAGFAADVPLTERVTQMLSSPLANRQLLLRFWSRGLLFSARARAEWMPPDRRPLVDIDP